MSGGSSLAANWQQLQADLEALDLQRFQKDCATAINDAAIIGPHCLPTPDFFSWLKLYLSKPDTFAFYRLQDSLSDIVRQYRNLSLRFEAVFNLLSHGGADEPLVRAWAVKHLSESFEDTTLLHTVLDGRALVDIPLLYFNENLFHHRTVPFILMALDAQPVPTTNSQHPTAPTGDGIWALGVLSSIFEKGFTRLFNAAHPKQPFILITNKFLEVDRMCCTIRCDVDSEGQLIAPRTVTPVDLAQFIRNLVNFEMYPELQRAIFIITNYVNDIPNPELRLFWLPFLHELLATMRAAAIPMPTLQYRTMFCAILESYVSKHSDAGEKARAIGGFDQVRLEELLGEETFSHVWLLAKTSGIEDIPKSPCLPMSNTNRYDATDRRFRAEDSR